VISELNPSVMTDLWRRSGLLRLRRASPREKRSGVGTRLLDAEPDAPCLWVSERNRPAQGFYRRNGLALESRRRMGSIFGTALPEIAMAR
jgi:hypothetical protein